VLPVVHVVVAGVRVSLALHALAILAGVAVGAGVVARRLPAPRGAALGAAAVVALAALVGARFLQRLMHGPGPTGLASFGGVALGLAVVPAVAALAGVPPARLADAIVPGGLAALAVGRIGCLLAGCCFGTPSAVPWAVVIPDLGPAARHPLQLYEALADVAIVVALPRRGLPAGAVAARGAVAYGVARAALEALRDPAAADALPGGLTLAQGAALALAAGGVLAGRRLRRPGAIDYGSRPEDSCAWPTRSR
jgi:phosphatidylglycerol:prolipoprotein diacylglycerol transferase